MSASRYSELQQRIAGRAGPVMFWLSLTFLVCMACLVVLWFDVPNLQENAASVLAGDQTTDDFPDSVASPLLSRGERLVVMLMMAIWPLVMIESAFHWLTRPWDRVTRKYHGCGVLFCLCPPLRMCARSPEMGERLWLHGWGWRRADKRLRKRLERKFSVPMIIIALMIMPILIVDFFLKAQVAQYAWLRLLLYLGTGVIWFAFAFEFILMFSVAEKKLAYCKKHWIDLAIILLPFISFLRSMRALRATRAAKLMRIPKLTKLARVYRLRGTAVKAIQALILLEFFQRVMSSNPERAISKLQERLDEVEEEAKMLKRKIGRLRRRQRELAGQRAREVTSASVGEIAAETASADQQEPNLASTPAEV